MIQSFYLLKTNLTLAIKSNKGLAALIMIAITLLCEILIGCTPKSNTDQNPINNLIWSEEFSSALDVTTGTLTSGITHQGIWRYNDTWQQIDRGYKDFAGQSWNINPLEIGFGSYNPFSISNGLLTLSSKRIPSELVTPITNSMAAQGQTGTPSWMGGILITDAAKIKFKYGYFEFKARFPIPGKGMFPAIWFFSSEGGTDLLNKGYAEIDLFEIFGNQAAKPWVITLHEKNSMAVGPSVSVLSTNDDCIDWHTYAVDWQPTYLKFYKDNVLVSTITGTDASFFNTTMAIRINYSMDASFFGQNLSDSGTPSTLTMELDYIRVYSSKP